MGDILKNLIGGNNDSEAGAAGGLESPMKRREVPGPDELVRTLASPFAEGALPLPVGPSPFRPAAEAKEAWAVKLELSDAGAVLDGTGLTGGDFNVRRMAEGLRVVATFRF